MGVEKGSILLQRGEIIYYDHRVLREAAVGIDRERLPAQGVAEWGVAEDYFLVYNMATKPDTDMEEFHKIVDAIEKKADALQASTLVAHTVIPKSVMTRYGWQRSFTVVFRMPSSLYGILAAKRSVKEALREGKKLSLFVKHLSE